MPAPASSTDRVQFGVFELDLQRAELRKSGVKVKLQEQPLKVLQVLLERPGQIVGREELQKRIWPVNTFVEFDQGLYSAMARLREALGDSSDSPRFIETVARRGYRFIAPISGMPRQNVQSSAKAEEPKSLALRRAIVSVLGGLLGGTLLLAGLLAFNVGGVRNWLRLRTTPIRSIAVLPLENLSGDPEQEYFTDGITDELITDLAQLPYLHVISRTSVMHYKKSKKTLPEIARELNVDAVVEGTVERSRNHVRIRVQLVRAGDDRHLWARAYERETGDLLSMQTDAAREIAEQVGINVGRSGQSVPGSNHSTTAEAYETYLKGRYYARTTKRADVEQAAAYFREAIRQDPELALAYAGLADAYLLEFFFGWNSKDADAKTREAATKALDIDLNLAEPHVTLARLAESDWNWTEADKQYKRAIELEPMRTRQISCRDGSS
jgi:TolB-like protein/DNA-binding winged helix-turn-helix (wHTH) protein